MPTRPSTASSPVRSLPLRARAVPFAGACLIAAPLLGTTAGAQRGIGIDDFANIVQ